MSHPHVRREPRWPALLALVAIGGLRLSLPDALAVGPGWLLLAVTGILVLPMLWAAAQESHQVYQVLGFLLNGLVTLDTLWSLSLLLRGLPRHTQSPVALLRSAAALWVSNILVFASWYWRLDAGGPHAREQRDRHASGSFLFPQMALPPEQREQMGWNRWSPGFVDYLFLAFNTSTAFSPTDAPVLSRWAKVLMMIQSLVSLSAVAFLAARAVNIL